MPISGKESQRTSMAPGGDCDCGGGFLAAWEEPQHSESALSWAVPNSCRADETIVCVVRDMLVLTF